MANAKKLPSGSWRVQAKATVNGKYVKKSFTADNKNEAEILARQWQMNVGKEKTTQNNLTLLEGIEKYIELKSAVFSPATIKGYNTIKRNYFDGIMDKPMSKITDDDIQADIDKMIADEYTPKTIINGYALVATVLKKYAKYTPDVTLPQKKKIQYRTPDATTLKKILKAVDGTNIELPIYLIVFLGLRISEVRGLKWSNVHDDYITIDEARVELEHGDAEKGTKNYSSTRDIITPQILKSKLEAYRQPDGYVINDRANTIYKRFIAMLKKNELPICDLHELRHANASIMLQVGIANKYAQARGGWSTDNTLKTVYQQTFNDGDKEAANKMDIFFNNLLKED